MRERNTMLTQQQTRKFSEEVKRGFLILEQTEYERKKKVNKVIIAKEKKIKLECRKIK